MSSRDFDELTSDEQDEVAREKIRDLLDKPELDERDAATVATCLAFLGTSQKIADKVTQALLDAAESLTTGLCVRCGSDVGEGPDNCLLCQAIRNAMTLRKCSRWVEPVGEVIPGIRPSEDHGLPEQIEPDVDETLEEPVLQELPDAEEILEEKLEREGDEKAQEELGIPDQELQEAIDQEPVRCPHGFAYFPPDFLTNSKCYNCIQRRRKYGGRPARCEWTGWGPEPDADTRLHRDYPHTFGSGKLNLTKASFELEHLKAREDRDEATDEDLKAIDHIRAHLKDDLRGRALEPHEALAETPGIKIVGRLPAEGEVPVGTTICPHCQTHVSHTEYCFNCGEKLPPEPIVEYEAKEDIEEGDLVAIDAEDKSLVYPIPKPWTDEELSKLKANDRLSPKAIASYVLRDRTEAEIIAKRLEVN